jgi:branched-chain amino acid transport system permease protein
VLDFSAGSARLAGTKKAWLGKAWQGMAWQGMAALFASPSLFADLVVNGLLLGGLYAIIAMGLNLQYGLLRILNIAHGEFLMIGAFVTYTLKVSTGANPLWFLPVTALVMFAGGLVLHAVVFRRLAAISANLDVLEERSLIVGFGLMFILQNSAVLIWGADLHGYDFMTDSVKFGEVVFTANRLVVLVLAVVISAGLILLLRFTLLGRAIRAMVQAPLGAMLVGINTRTLHPICFALGLALAGLAGGLLSMIYVVTPDMGTPYLITALIVITLGGLGSVTGSLFGGFLLGLVESFGVYFTDPSLKILLSYAVFVLVLLVRPKGLFAR